MSDQPETSREAFEKWARANGFIVHKSGFGNYAAVSTRNAWKAWRAAAYWADTGELPGGDS